MYSDFKIIWVLSLILLVIILLTGIKTCSIPVFYNKFIDRRYTYISEPFIELDSHQKDIINLNNKYLTSNMDKMVLVKSNEKKIKDMKNMISELETKLNRIMN
jgi:hypothetical protein